MKSISHAFIRFTAMMAVVAFLASAWPAAALAQSASGLSLTVTVSALNVRQGPGTNYPIVGALHQGDQRPVSGRDAGGAWYQVPVLAGGAQLGWVFATFVQLSGDATYSADHQRPRSCRRGGNQGRDGDHGRAGGQRWHDCLPVSQRRPHLCHQRRRH